MHFFSFSLFSFFCFASIFLVQQVPQLSTSSQMDINDNFFLNNPSVSIRLTGGSFLLVCEVCEGGGEAQGKPGGSCIQLAVVDVECSSLRVKYVSYQVLFTAPPAYCDCGGCCFPEAIMCSKYIPQVSPRDQTRPLGRFWWAPYGLSSLHDEFSVLHPKHDYSDNLNPMTLEQYSLCDNRCLPHHRL